MGKKSPYDAGKYTYLAVIENEKITLKAGSQMTAVNKILRSHRKLPRRWDLKLRENGRTIEFWVFDELGMVVAPDFRGSP